MKILFLIFFLFWAIPGRAQEPEKPLQTLVFADTFLYKTERLRVLNYYRAFHDSLKKADGRLFSELIFCSVPAVLREEKRLLPPALPVFKKED